MLIQTDFAIKPFSRSSHWGDEYFKNCTGRLFQMDNPNAERDNKTFALGEITAFAKAISQTVYYLQTSVSRIEELQRRMLAGAEAQKENRIPLKSKFLRF
jgi:hypothetical protein